MKSSLLPCIGLAAVSVALVSAKGQAQENVRTEVGKGISVVHSRRWTTAEARYRNAFELVAFAQARMLITTETRRDHAEAVRRLSEIARETNSPVRFLDIGGWPALERRYEAPLERTGDEKPRVSGPPQMTVRVTTAIAAGIMVVRLDTTLAPEADPTFATEAEAIGRSVMLPSRGEPGQTKQEIQSLRESTNTSSPPRSMLAPPGPAGQRAAHQPAPAKTGADIAVQTGLGELEVAASTNGQNVVVAANSGYSSSSNGGGSFTFRGGTPSPFPADGDPSLGVGVSGAFYYGFIGYPNGSAAALGVNGCSTGISASTDNGVTFPFRNHAVVCPNTGSVCFPDQPHITADRFNAAPGGDQIYSVWRNFTPTGSVSSCSFGSGYVTPSIVCSANGGTTWTTPTAIGAGDFPRITVGSDGFVYVAYRSGANGMINKYSSCSAGLAQQVGFPVTVAAFNDVTCPVPGLDRCNDGNSLASHMVAVDDTNASHIYVAYATNTATGNENVIVRHSKDGGSTWPDTITVNASATGRRFMPWVCATGGNAYISWYDRRAATATHNDYTDYYLGSAVVRGGVLQSGGEQNLTNSPDPQCASGWPCGARSTTDYTSCSVPSGGSAGGGCPKYGDYNGSACISNRIYNAWASATAPAGLSPVTGITVFSSTVAASDFYVRDWTDSPSSGDDGAQPSTHADFYTTSDVWNRRGTLPGGPPFPNDQPPNEDAGNGPGIIGDNWAFARIRRNSAPPTGSSLVSAHFLVSKFGTGSNFVDSTSGDPDVSMDPSDPTATFNAGDLGPLITPAYHWHLNSIAGNHLCLAVEISAVGDPYLPPSLVGSSPGSSAVESRVTADNNKAQRNMGLSTTPARGVGGSAGGAYCAIVHNAATASRTITLRYTANADVMEKLRDVRVSMIGERDRSSQPSTALNFDQQNRTLQFNDMLPGENRWVCITFRPVPGKEGELLPVKFDEMAGETAVNGFAMGARLAPMRQVIHNNMELHASVFRRLEALFQVSEAGREGKIAQEFATARETTDRTYLEYIRSHFDPMKRIIAEFNRSQKAGDPFDIKAALEALGNFIRSDNAASVSVAHSAVLNRLESFVTMRQLANGDPADVLQMVRWQKELYSSAPQLKALPVAPFVESKSLEFIDGIGRRTLHSDSYPDLIRELLPSFHETAEVLEKLNMHVEPEISAMEHHTDSLAALEKTHREYLLRLQSLIK